jgi:hypothetical protein
MECYQDKETGVGLLATHGVITDGKQFGGFSTVSEVIFKKSWLQISKIMASFFWWLFGQM